MGKILNLCESKLKHPVLFCLMFVVKRGRTPLVYILTMLEMSFLHEFDKKMSGLGSGLDTLCVQFKRK